MNEEQFGTVWLEKGEAFWKKMWDGRRIMHALVASIALEEEPSVSILEVGAGFGYMKHLLIEMGHTGIYAGNDISEKGCAKIESWGDLALCGDYMKLPVIPKADVTIIEGVIDHQNDWRPMCLRALEFSKRVVVGVRGWSGEDHHVSKWVEDGHYFDTHYSRKQFEAEASELELWYRILEYPNPLHSRSPEVVFQLTR